MSDDVSDESKTKVILGPGLEDRIFTIAQNSNFFIFDEGLLWIVTNACGQMLCCQQSSQADRENVAKFIQLNLPKLSKTSPHYASFSAFLAGIEEI